MRYEATQVGERNMIRIEVGADDLPRWDGLAICIRGLLEIMADSEARRHRKMLPEDWAGLLAPVNKQEGL